MPRAGGERKVVPARGAGSGSGSQTDGMDRTALIAEASLSTAIARLKGDQPGAVHAALAVSIAHQLLGLMKLAGELAANQSLES